MKKHLHIILLAAAGLLVSANKSNAQTLGITINWAGDTLWTWPAPCGVPDTIATYIYGTAGGYLTTDSVTLYVAFGDGTDTTFKTPIYQGSYFSSYIPHAYNLPGIYSLMFIATGPNGAADTVINNNSVVVADQCGNLTGKVYLDANSDCVFNGGDTPFQWYHVRLWYNGSVVESAYTDVNGNYSFSVPTGFNYSVDVVHPNSNIGTSCPVSGSYSITTLPAYNKDFALACTQSGYDLTGSMSGWGVRPGFQATFYFGYWNTSCQNTSGTVTVTLPTGLTFVSGNPAPSNVTGNVLTYNVSSFNYFWLNGYSYNSIVVLGAPTLVIGDTLCVDMLIDPQSGDLNPADNSIQCCVPVRNSCDPNEKYEAHAGWNSGYIKQGEDLDYTIFFQNVGNDVAYNVNVVDTIDGLLDASALQIVSSSHPVKIYAVGNNVIKFQFSNINLASSAVNEPMSHGFVRFKALQIPLIPNGVSINNKAHIYFDFNAAIETNLVIDIINIASGIKNNSNTSFEYFPNPTTEFVTLKTGTDKPVTFRLIDIAGNVVMNKQVKDGEKIALGNFASGIYSMIIITDTKQLNNKLVITKH